ncbi:hypothetical protein K5I29_02010 [Flavobacterium agricola]|uniref:Uncharacterized protein n=1 Tax=Flavobacterium agricola TaxID=2870839 RepID=A0ABY6M302_9FLAO|nr:hypothetical protein [Flavobacterium agricola]UYW01723.1 hypothetical protein K5I29_02010 [Flavobacterium agricola]
MKHLNDKQLIRKIVKELLDKRQSIFELLTQFTIATEFKELDNTFEFKEDQQFTLADFADSENQNVVLLVDMCHKLDQTIYELINYNNLTETDLQ